MRAGLHAQAVADRLGLRIVVLSTFEESPVIEIHPHGGTRSDRMLHLSFWAEARALLQQRSPLCRLSRCTLSEVHGRASKLAVWATGALQLYLWRQRPAT